MAPSTARDGGLLMPAETVALSPWSDLTCSGDSMARLAMADVACTRAGPRDGRLVHYS